MGMRYEDFNEQSCPVFCGCSRADDYRLSSSAATTRRSADDDEFLGTVGWLHDDLGIELRRLCHAQQQRDFSQRRVLYRQ